MTIPDIRTTTAVTISGQRNPARQDAGRSSEPAERVGTVVIGAGQTGLATACHLQRLGLEAVVLEGNARVGDVWRKRYDSLRLFTPSQYDGLPGMPFPMAKHRFPTGQQMADYLEAYVEQMNLTVRTSTTVRRVTRAEEGEFLVATNRGPLLAHDVVVATGAQRVPRVPDIADRLDPGIRQLHSNDYRSPAQLLPGPTLVVGAGTSGADLALEIATAGHETWLSGKIPGQIPFDIEGPAERFVLPLLWLAANHVLTTRTPIGRRMMSQARQHGGPLLRVKAADLEAAGVHLNPARTVGVHDGRPELADATALDVANVVWCTGYRPDFSILDPSVCGEDGWPLEDGGVVPSAPGLYFVGLPFQRGFTSMLVGGAGKDGRCIAEQVRVRSRTRTA